MLKLKWIVVQNYLSFLTGHVAARVLLIILAAFIGWFLSRLFVKRVVVKIIKKTTTTIDDALLEHGLPDSLVLFVPFVIIGTLSPYAITFSLTLKRVADAGIAIALGSLIANVLSLLNSIYERHELSRKWPIRGYIQFVKIIVWVGAGVSALCLLIGTSPWSFLSGLGALSAIIMLVFRNTLLSFVATFQVLSQDLLRIGDWIEMPQYGADGEVVDITFSNVIVRNWDNTLVVIPAYKLLEDSFKNWRGMEMVGARRIKRAIYIDQNSVRFCDDEMIERFKRIHLIRDYIERKIREIEEDAKRRNVDLEASVLNGRRLTNLGTFRIYVEEYLKAHPMVRKDLTLMVRQLDPTPQGLPLEVYCFVADTRWVPYERVQADIFDHILASVPEFGLSIFQFPSDRVLATSLKSYTQIS